MAYFAGIDGGGSKTQCVVGDEKCILGRGSAASSKLASVGREQTREALLGALNVACREAEISPEQIESVCVGMSGAGRSEGAQHIQEVLAGSLRSKIEVVGDMVIALAAALGDKAGVVVIAGTGSIAYGRNQHGELARAGGWGPKISDEGSGGWIGRRAVATALCDHDSAQESTLLPFILDAWSTKNVHDLVSLANNANQKQYADLFPALANAAESGSATARSIFNGAAEELSRLAVIVLRRLWSESDEVHVYMSGGVFEHSELIRKTFAESVQKTRPATKICEPIVQPAEGALALARKAAVLAASKR